MTRSYALADARPRRGAQLAPEVKAGFGEALGVFGRIGCLSFGGPAGQIALMHRVLVDERHWIGEERFLHALNYCMLLPGPEAQQLATYARLAAARREGRAGRRASCSCCRAPS